ncbi:MAG: 2-phospho-L-lactate guanylyltransferase [Pseudomonadales bacterium]|nr:2-phospho-L-lactate guanylyltransferase [Pseudomonadales bacterium]
MHNRGIITAAVVPIKSLQKSKQRLANLLSQQQRADLSLAMLKDILHTLLLCRDIHKIVIVTSDPQINRIVLDYDLEVLPEPAQTGLINAVTYAGETLAKQGVHRMLFIPADVPLVREQEIQRILNPIINAKELTHPGLIHSGLMHIVPATQSGGSNCISCMPADCMTFSFGENSCARHVKIARQLNLHTIVTKLAGIGLDVDTPEDLAQLAQQLMTDDSDERFAVRGQHTYRFLLDSGILKHLQTPERVAEYIRARN